jgi:hypothetical protein
MSCWYMVSLPVQYDRARIDKTAYVLAVFVFQAIESTRMSLIRFNNLVKSRSSSRTIPRNRDQGSVRVHGTVPPRSWFQSHPL